MASKAEQYRRKAEEAEKLAEVARDYHAKAIYLDIARKWRELADQIERRGECLIMQPSPHRRVV